jgi:hypothetical protein
LLVGRGGPVEESFGGDEVELAVVGEGVAEGLHFDVQLFLFDVPNLGEIVFDLLLGDDLFVFSGDG